MCHFHLAVEPHRIFHQRSKFKEIFQQEYLTAIAITNQLLIVITNAQIHCIHMQTQQQVSLIFY